MQDILQDEMCENTGYLQDSTIELNNENIVLIYDTSCRQCYGPYGQVSCHFIIMPQLLPSKYFSYTLILTSFTLKFILSVISECLIQFLFPKP